MRAILILITLTGAAWADDLAEVRQTNGWHISTAYHCQAFEGGTDRFERAKSISLKRLTAAGIAPADAEQEIGATVALLVTDDGANAAITSELCSDLLANLDRP